MRILLFFVLCLVSAPLGVLTFELLDIFVRPDRMAPLVGLDPRFDEAVRLAVTGVVPTVMMLGLWTILTRSRVRTVAQPQLHDIGREARLIKAERDYWRQTVARLLESQQVSEADRDLLFETIRKTLEDRTIPAGEPTQAKSLVAER